MISPRHKAIFFHVGKAAGTAVERMLVPARFHSTKKVARFEDLPSSLDVVRRRLRIDRELTRENVLPQTPALAGRSPAEVYDRKMISTMREVFELDFGTFGYADEPGEKR